MKLLNKTMEEKEIWKDIPGWEGFYRVSNMGRVKSLSRRILINGKYPHTTQERILKPQTKGSGYLGVNLCKDGNSVALYIHVLVAICFLGHEPEVTGLQVNHKDWVKTNNNVSNLEIVTHRENSSYKEKPPKSNLTGVKKTNRKTPWVARIRIGGELMSLGCFNTKIEAYEAYKNAVNALNRGEQIPIKRKQYSSQYKGVYWNKRTKSWRASIKINKKTKHLGLFKDEISASKAYERALSELRSV